MNEQRFQNCLHILLESISDNDFTDEDGDTFGHILEGFSDNISEVRSFNDEGMLTNNKGLVVRLEGGSEFQLTIVKRK
jgi:hypothetical protein